MIKAKNKNKEVIRMKWRKTGIYLLMSVFLLTGCADAGSEGEGGKEEGGVSAQSDGAEEEKMSNVTELPDGTYVAEFHTDSSMFHVKEACEGKGTLTVENGEMVIHISLASKNIVKLYPGLAEDAQKEEDKALLPTTDEVTYSDGITEEVYGFDVPVPVLGEEFDLALIGKKGTWYDHKVSVSDPAPAEDEP